VCVSACVWVCALGPEGIFEYGGGKVYFGEERRSAVMELDARPLRRAVTRVDGRRRSSGGYPPHQESGLGLAAITARRAAVVLAGAAKKRAF
jgi:hypothetical protein